MNRRRMILTLAMLFIVGLFLIGFGDWLWSITLRVFTAGYHGGFVAYYFWKPYGVLGLLLVGCGVFSLAVAIGLLFDWHHLLIHKHT